VTISDPSVHWTATMSVVALATEVLIPREDERLLLRLNPMVERPHLGRMNEGVCLLRVAPRDAAWRKAGILSAQRATG
jgi:hypothetical protein